MDDAQIGRISNALQKTSDAIHGINAKFDIVDEHWKGSQIFNSGIRTRVEGTLESFQRLDKTMNIRIAKALEVVHAAAVDLTQVMNKMVSALEEFDMQREINQLPKALIPVMVPLVILMIELAIANAYLGILLTRLPEVAKYSTYLLANAAFVLLGLMLGLLWLAGYRCLLFWRTGQKKRRRNDDILYDSSHELPAGPAEGEEVDEVDKGRVIRTLIGPVRTSSDVQNTRHSASDGPSIDRQLSNRPSCRASEGSKSRGLRVATDDFEAEPEAHGARHRRPRTLADRSQPGDVDLGSAASDALSRGSTIITSPGTKSARTPP